MRKRPDRGTRDVELEMTPMIDVTFLLLIFFMCTIQFKTLEGKLSAFLPKDVGPSPQAAEPIEPIEVRILVRSPGTRLEPDGRTAWDGGGRFVLGPDRVVEYRVGPATLASVEALGERLAGLYRSGAERPLRVDPGPGVVQREVVRVIDAATAAGCREIVVAGARD